MVFSSVRVFDLNTKMKSNATELDFWEVRHEGGIFRFTTQMAAESYARGLTTGSNLLGVTCREDRSISISSAEAACCARRKTPKRAQSVA